MNFPYRNFSHFYDVISKTKINAVSASSIFHYNVVVNSKLILKKLRLEILIS